MIEKGRLHQAAFFIILQLIMRLKYIRVKIIICLLFALICAPHVIYAKCHNVAPANNTHFDATVGVFFTQTWSGNGNCTPWTSSYPNGYLGLTFTNGTLSGTPTGTVTNYPFTVTENNGVVYSYTLTITAGGCSFVSGVSNGAISFGSIDPTGTAEVIGSVTSPQFTCAAGTSYTVAVNPASGWQISSGANNIGYTLGVVSGGTYSTPVNVFTAAESKITQPAYVNAPAGAYSNASPVTVTIGWTGGSITASLPVGSVSATVINACAVAGNPSIDFGVLDGVTHAGGATAAVAPPAIMCTRDASVSVSDNGGLHFSGTPRMSDASGNYLPYNIQYSGSLTALGGATDIGGSGAGRLSLGASIPANSLDNVPAGTYSDTITLTISY